MPNYKKLAGEKVYLSPVSTDDWEIYNKWANDYDLTYLYYGGRDKVAPPASGPDSLERRAKKKNAFTIVDIATGAVIGQCQFNTEDTENRYAEIGISIGEREYWSRGCGSDALRLLLGFGFRVKGYNSIGLNVFEFNPRALACYEKAGFKRQGVWRDCLKRGGKLHSSIYMDILASEYFGDAHS